LLNLIFNFAFTPLQFGLKDNLWAAIDILLVDATLVWAFVILWQTTADLRWIIFVNIPYLFISGLVIFVISPAFQKNSWVYALLYGALFGLITYATYDLTNLATLKDWPIMITLVDLAWGATLAASVSVITYLIAVRIGL